MLNRRVLPSRSPAVTLYATLTTRHAAATPIYDSRVGGTSRRRYASRCSLQSICSSNGSEPAAAQGLQDPSSNGNGRRIIGLTGRERLGGPGSSNGNAGHVSGELVPTDDGSGGVPPRVRNGDGGGGGDNGDGQPGGGGVWRMVLSVVMAAAAAFAASSWFRDRGAVDAPRKRPVREDVAALKRLLREAFAELTEQGGRLHALEQRGPAKGGGGWTVGADLAPSRAADITFVGAVETTPALVLSQGPSAAALHAACATPDDAGGSGAPLLRGQLRSEARGGADQVSAEVMLPCGGGADGSLRPTLQKVVYTLGAEADAQRKWKLLLGRGRGDDVAATLNPAAGRGLTHLLRHGCALHQRVAGSGVGVVLHGGERLHAAVAHLVSASAGECPRVGSSLAQATVAVSDACSVGLVALRQRRHSARRGAHGSYVGWQLEGQLGDVALPLQGGPPAAVQHTLAATGTLDVQQAALLSWWAAQSAGRSSDGNGIASKQLEFGVSLASHPLKGPGGWAIVFGRSRGPQLPGALTAGGATASGDGSTGASSGSAAATSPMAGADGGRGGNGTAAAAAAAAEEAPAAAATFSRTPARQTGPPAGSGASAAVHGSGGGPHDTDADNLPWIAEASLQVSLGEGLAVTPGVVAVHASGAITVALAARMQWAF